MGQAGDEKGRQRDGGLLRAGIHQRRDLTDHRQAGEGNFSINPKYTVSGANYVSGIALNTKVSDFVKNLNIQGGYAQVRDSGGVKGNSEKVVTGDTVYVYYDNGTQYAKWTVLIYGDVNGDGKITNMDRSSIRDHILGTYELSHVYAVAGDINSDGKISNSDRMQVRDHVLGLVSIKQ